MERRTQEFLNHPLIDKLILLVNSKQRGEGADIPKNPTSASSSPSSFFFFFSFFFLMAFLTSVDNNFTFFSFMESTRHVRGPIA